MRAKKGFNLKNRWVVVSIFVIAFLLYLYTLTAGSICIPVTSDEAIRVLQAKQFASGKPKLFLWQQPYQFPMQSLLEAPTVNLLPRNAFGARFFSFLTAFVSIALILLVLRKSSSPRHYWPGAALLLFPSAYILMTRFGYPMLGYTSVAFFWALAMLLTMYIPRKLNMKGAAIIILTGFVCGLAYTNNMLSLAVVVPIAIVVCFGNGLKNMLVRTPLYATGCFLGLLPYLAGIWRYPEARGVVSATRSWQAAWSRIWSPAISHTLPRTLGADPTLFPDSRYTLGQPGWIVAAIAYFYVAVLLFATLVCLYRQIRNIAGRKWPSLSLAEIVVGSSWLGLIMFVFSMRADSASYRYLLPVAWCFPLLVYCAYAGLPRRIKPVLGGVVILLVCFNVVNSLALIQRWQEPAYAKDVVNAPDLGPALDFLREEGIEYCVASHWAAYRINFLTDEKIKCSQPMNERFPGWPLPYKEEVDAQTNLAYVLTEQIRFLKPTIFERHLRTMDVDCRHETRGAFEIYYDFQRKNPPSGENLLQDRNRIELATSRDSREVGNMVDGDQQSFWRSDRLQASNMWVRVDLGRTARLDRLMVYRGIYANDHPEKLAIEKQTAAGWKAVPYRVYNDWGDTFRFENGHPVYGAPAVKSYLFGDLVAESLRLRILEPRGQWAWTITELELWGLE